MFNGHIRPQGLKARKTTAQGKPAAAGAALGQQINKQSNPRKGETDLATTVSVAVTTAAA
jgi:hypothetical protein